MNKKITDGKFLLKRGITNNWMMKVLITLGVAFFSASIFLFQIDATNWKTEVAKSLMGLAMTAIIGGFIKLIFDENLKRETKEKSKKEFKVQLLNQVRRVFDAVGGARLLIEAHESAKTYGEQMREKIISSIPALYDVKRSLLDSRNVFRDEQLKRLRLSLHYMIAYLKALSEEYAENYLQISNIQYFQEALREKAKESFQNLLGNDFDSFKEKLKSNDFFEKTGIPDPPEFAWNKILMLNNLKDFLTNDHHSKYNKYFIGNYEYSKKILKGILPGKKEPFNPDYLIKLEEIDDRRNEVDSEKSDDLVEIIMTQELNYILEDINIQDKKNGDAPNESLCQDNAFEAWKYHASVGGADKDRMIQIATWLLGFSAAIIGFIFKEAVNSNKIVEPVPAIWLSAIGFIVSLISAVMTLLYGGYANWNWAKADQIANKYKWHLLGLESKPFETPKKRWSLSAWALRRSEARRPEKKLAPVFYWFFWIALGSLLLHLSILIWSTISLVSNQRLS